MTSATQRCRPVASVVIHTAETYGVRLATSYAAMSLWGCLVFQASLGTETKEQSTHDERALIEVTDPCTYIQHTRFVCTCYRRTRVFSPTQPAGGQPYGEVERASKIGASTDTVVTKSASTVGCSGTDTLPTNAGSMAMPTPQSKAFMIDALGVILGLQFGTGRRRAGCLPVWCVECSNFNWWCICTSKETPLV